ncbi:hypothetical protein CU665_19630 [Pseudomonas syringae pv. actinidifoliorum]|nr:hypothetical protein [Pseudomonas syringae pv. actinidifoliorum]
MAVLPSGRAIPLLCSCSALSVLYKSAFDSGRRRGSELVREDGSSVDAFFGECTGPFANKFAPTPFGQKPIYGLLRTCVEH